MKTIKEKNMLLADFVQKGSVGIGFYQRNGNLYELNDLEFNHNWDWIIEVVEVIENLGFIVTTVKKVVTIINGYDNINVYSDRVENITKLDALFDVCVNFVRFYKPKKMTVDIVMSNIKMAHKNVVKGYKEHPTKDELLAFYYKVSASIKNYDDIEAPENDVKISTKDESIWIGVEIPMFDTTMKICIGIGLEDNGTEVSYCTGIDIEETKKHGDDPWINNADYTISKGKVFDDNHNLIK